MKTYAACEQVMMAGYLKTTCGVLQMVSNGNEGYRVHGTYDPYASTAYPFNVRSSCILCFRTLSYAVCADCFCSPMLCSCLRSP